ncbi:11137_t:CDS:1 [Ambispora gerdemannii]|uniref:11137_t:CDS:1 n=1 Tax=Ambispora gerdemannii TaxID=144530 RepID=A0A9N8YYW2_9GLOM|nr:11137_t:CDS:1 [Ambispora gerdemannii]
MLFNLATKSRREIINAFDGLGGGTNFCVFGNGNTRFDIFNVNSYGGFNNNLQREALALKNRSSSSIFLTKSFGVDEVVIGSWILNWENMFLVVWILGLSKV